MDIIIAGQKTKSMFLVNRQLCLLPDDPTSSKKGFKEQEDKFNGEKSNLSSIVEYSDT